MDLQKELGKKKQLMIVKIVDFGVYLGTKDDKVLLPKREVPQGLEIGDNVEVFLYKDSSDRLIATTETPKVLLGETKVLTVKDNNSKVGAFLDWGLPKDLLLPYREQTSPVRKGEEVLVSLYVDKTGRLCATMKVYEKLSKDTPYEKDSEVTGRVYQISDNFGAFVAVDDQYSALIPKKELFGKVRVGDVIQARVTKVHEDGKMDLAIRKRAHLQMDDDANMLLSYLEEHDGEIPFTDKADADVIKKEFHMSKNAFKRAVGHLLKEKKISIEKDYIALK